MLEWSSPPQFIPLSTIWAALAAFISFIFSWAGVVFVSSRAVPTKEAFIYLLSVQIVSRVVISLKRASRFVLLSVMDSWYSILLHLQFCDVMSAVYYYTCTFMTLWVQYITTPAVSWRYECSILLHLQFRDVMSAVYYYTCSFVTLWVQNITTPAISWRYECSMSLHLKYFRTK